MAARRGSGKRGRPPDEPVAFSADCALLSAMMASPFALQKDRCGAVMKRFGSVEVTDSKTFSKFWQKNRETIVGGPPSGLGLRHDRQQTPGFVGRPPTKVTFVQQDGTHFLCDGRTDDTIDLKTVCECESLIQQFAPQIMKLQAGSNLNRADNAIVLANLLPRLLPQRVLAAGQRRNKDLPKTSDGSDFTGKAVLRPPTGAPAPSRQVWHNKITAGGYFYTVKVLRKHHTTNPG